MIKAPNWRPDAKIDRRGWVCPKNGELLAARKFTQAQIDEFNGVEAPKPKKAKKAKKAGTLVETLKKVEDLVGDVDVDLSEALKSEDEAE